LGRKRPHRAAAGLTQEELAERAGLSARGISDLERGRRAHPHYETVRVLDDALGLGDEDRAALMAAGREQATSAQLAGLPSPLTSLIGQEDDVRAVCQLLEQPDVRLVNLAGAGGVGETRLVLQIATESIVAQRARPRAGAAPTLATRFAGPATACACQR